MLTPNPAALVIYRMPALMVVSPVKVLELRKLKVLEAEVSLIKEPPPEITPTTVLLADDEYWKTAPVAIFSVLAVVLVQVPEPPICKMPPEITAPL